MATVDVGVAFREVLAQDLRRAQRERDTDGVRLCRILIAAIDNAGAVAAPQRWDDTRPRLGTTEVPRRRLDVPAVRALLRQEIEDRRAAAPAYRSGGRPVEADRLEREQRRIVGYLGDLAHHHATSVGVRFRRLTDDDLPLLHGWLNEPGVVRWWEGDDVSWDGVVRDYGSANADPVEHWIATADGRDLGWIQCYAAADFPEEHEPWFALGVPRTTAGIDYLVGDPAQRGRGVGAAMIAAFVDAVVFGDHPEWDAAAAAPFVENVASWRALANAGFVAVADLADPLGPLRLMLRTRLKG